jgi:hypothetical protein
MCPGEECVEVGSGELPLERMGGALAVVLEGQDAIRGGRRGEGVSNWGFVIIGAEFEILDPPDLAEHILALAGRLTRAAHQ